MSRVLTLVLVEGEDDDRAVGVEAVVVEQWIEPVLEEVGAEVGGGVVRVVDHVRCDEDHCGMAEALMSAAKSLKLRIRCTRSGMDVMES